MEGLWNFLDTNFSLKFSLFRQSDWFIVGQRLHGIGRNSHAMEAKNPLVTSFGGIKQ
jgi:hypothetical protein